MEDVETNRETFLQRQTPDSLMLYGFWYRALAGKQVSRNQLHKVTLLETPLVIGRDHQGRRGDGSRQGPRPGGQQGGRLLRHAHGAAVRAAQSIT